MKKMLMVASVASMIDQFNMHNIKTLQKMGLEVHVACNFEKGNTCSLEKVHELKITLQEMNVSYFHIEFARDIKNIHKNLRAYKQVVELLKNEEYEFIHCHSPIGGVIARLAGRKSSTKIIYTAHGFHFYNGAPLKNWLIYFPIERFLSRYTDTLITINKEDYIRGKNFKAKRVEYVPGVGIDTRNFGNDIFDKKNKRKELGIDDNDIVLLSVGELSTRKNHNVVLEAIANFNETLLDTKFKYLICGQGDLESNLKELSKTLEIEKQVEFLGFRKDISEICVASDVFVFPSLQEGLPVALMEAMACGLPVICSDIRGNTDLIENNKGGYLVRAKDVSDFEKKITILIKDQYARAAMGKLNKENIQKFDFNQVEKRMIKIYSDI